MRRRGTAGIVVLVLLGALLLAGCGGGSAVAACDLLSDEGAERILGTPTRPGEVDDDEGPGTSCAWISEDSTREPEAAVYGVHLWSRTDDAARTEFDRRRTRDSDIYDIEPVAGLGDEAYFVVYTEPNAYSGTPSLPDLYVRTGDRVLGIGTFDSDERPVDIREARVIERSTARVALTRLGDD